jgi:hypothetical protein
MKYTLLAFALALAACGAEAPPTYTSQTSPGETVSGEVIMGVTTKL